MRYSEIKVGEEYAVGKDYYPQRAKVLDVGEFDDSVWVRYRSRSVRRKGAFVQYLDIRTGEAQMNTGMLKFVDCTGCNGTGEVDRPDRDFTDVMVKVQCDDCQGAKQVRQKVPPFLKTDWISSRELLKPWSDHVASVKAKDEYEAKKQKAYNLARDRAAVLQVTVRDAGLTRSYASPNGGSIQLSLTYEEAGRLIFLLEANPKVEGDA